MTPDRRPCPHLPAPSDQLDDVERTSSDQLDDVERTSSDQLDDVQGARSSLVD